MKMTIGTELPPEYVVNHGDLAQTAGSFIGHALLPLFIEHMPEEAAKANVEAILTELAYQFDEGQIEIGGKIYRPRMAFVDDNGTILPGAAQMDDLHAMVTDPFDIPEEANITFESDDFEDE